MNPSNWFKNAVETVRKHKREYLLSKYGLNNYQIGRFVKRIIEDEGVKRRGGGGQKSRLEQVKL